MAISNKKPMDFVEGQQHLSLLVNDPIIRNLWHMVTYTSGLDLQTFDDANWRGRGRKGDPGQFTIAFSVLMMARISSTKNSYDTTLSS